MKPEAAEGIAFVSKEGRNRLRIGDMLVAVGIWRGVAILLSSSFLSLAGAVRVAFSAALRGFVAAKWFKILFRARRIA